MFLFCHLVVLSVAVVVVVDVFRSCKLRLVFSKMESLVKKKINNNNNS